MRQGERTALLCVLASSSRAALAGARLDPSPELLERTRSRSLLTGFPCCLLCLASQTASPRRCTSPAASEAFFAAASSQDKVMHLVPGGFHEVRLRVWCVWCCSALFWAAVGRVPPLFTGSFRTGRVALVAREAAVGGVWQPCVCMLAGGL